MPGWLASLIHSLQSIPDGVTGAIIGVLATQLVTSVSTYRRRRDEYRAPQRAAIGGLLAAANQLKVSISAAVEYSGLSPRETSDEGSLEVLNTFFRELFGLDEAFEIAFLTVVDGPCYDQLVAAEKPFQALRKAANNPLVSRTDTAEGFARFIVQLGTASDNLDDDLGHLVALAQQRLRPSRRLLSRRSTAKRPPKPRPSIERGDKPSGPATQTAFLLSQGNQASSRQRVTLTEEPLSLNAGGAGPPEGAIRIHGSDLTKAHTGGFVVGTDGTNPIGGQIVDLLPIITATERTWVATIQWASPKGQRIDTVKVGADDAVDLVEKK